MPRENALLSAAARLAGVPFAMRRHRPFHAPHKALIMQTCCLSQVMLATPLLAALSESYVDARFDWLLGDWSRPAVAGNPHVTEIVSIGDVGLQHFTWRQIGRLILRLRAEHYDTAFIPNNSALLSLIAWQAGIHQRVGLSAQGCGFAQTIAISPQPGLRDRGAQGLLLAEAVGIDQSITSKVNMEFRPPDRARRHVTQRLIEEVDWLGDVPLIIIHPGGGHNPLLSQPLLRWPVERFVILGNYLTQAYGARVVLAGTKEECALVNDVAGMMAGKVTNYCGRITLAELGAMSEVADLYVGNDSGPGHVAVACGCQTLLIYGPTNPADSKPYSTLGNVHILWHDLSEFAAERPFTWEIGVTAEEAIKAADKILQQSAGRERAMAILSRRPREKN